MQDTTIKYERLTELCVLMEGLLHVQALRPNPTGIKLLERYSLEFEVLLAPLISQNNHKQQENDDIIAAETTECPAETTADYSRQAESAIEEEEADADVAPAEEPEHQAEADIVSSPEPASAEDMMTAESESTEVAQVPADTVPENAVTEDDVPEDEGIITRPGELRVDEMLSRREARSLRRAFTINDKFRFRRELFGNDDRLFGNTIDMIEAMKDMDEAIIYMRDNLGWNFDDENVQDFANIVANHFAEI